MAWQQTIDDLASYLTTLFADSETYLLEVLAYRMERDMTIWDDDLARLRLVNELRTVTAAEVAYLTQQRPLLAEWVAQTAVEEGAAGIADVLTGVLPDAVRPFGTQWLFAQTAVAVDLASRLEDVTNRILRFPQDVYQRLGAVLVSRKLTGAQHTIDFQREMLRDWYRWGIPAFTDVSGRTWRAGSYVEMLTRTGAQRALTDGRQAQLTGSGFRFGLIHELSSACDRCAPWAGQVIALDGDSAPVTVTNLRTGQPMVVRPRGTLQQARQAGWQHPNCRGTLNAYIPGVNTARFERPDTSKLNDAEANLREVERDARQAKRDLVIDPSNAAAKRDLLDAQASARKITRDHDIARRPWRESLEWSGDRIARTRRATPTRPPRRGTPPEIPHRNQLDA